MSDDLHKDHRKRVRKAFLENGFTDETPSHQILEMLLFYSIPRGDTNETAHRLLNEFGSVEGIFEADISELKRVRGIGENSAILIKLMLPLIKKYQADKIKGKPRFNNITEILGFLENRYLGIKCEMFSIMSFGNNGNMLGFDKVGEGDVSSVGVSVREIVKTVLKRNAACVIIAHNHLESYAIPSKSDIELTKTLKDTLNQMGVNLIDHVIISNDGLVSMAQSKNYRSIFF